MDTQTLLADDNARVALVVNAGSRRGRDTFDDAKALLTSGGVQNLDAYGVESGADLIETLERVVATKPDLMIVGGGDGTVGAAATLVDGSDVVLGVLPLGTANDFARTLELSPDPTRAVSELLGGKIVDVDIGRADDRCFLNVASFGLSVEVTQKLTPRMKRRLGPLAYPVATLRAYRHHRPFHARLEFPDGDHETMELDDLLQVAVGSGRHYGAGNTVSPTASVDDGMLDVYAIQKGRLRDHVSIARLLRSGTFVEHEQVEHVVTTAVRVETDEPLPVNLDGEIGDTTPTVFGVDRNAVHLVVPAWSRAARLENPVD